MKLRLTLLFTLALIASAAASAAGHRTSTRHDCHAAADTTYFPQDRPYVIIYKEKMVLCVYDADGTEVRRYGIACGRNVGDKQCAGDMRTPVGMFKVQEILDAHTWKHDFGDGNGVIAGAYGPRFVRLVTGHNGIGIHGTHDESSIGTLATEGCIRLHNADILEFATKFAYRGMPVIIIPSTADIIHDRYPVADPEADGSVE